MQRRASVVLPDLNATMINDFQYESPIKSSIARPRHHLWQQPGSEPPRATSSATRLTEYLKTVTNAHATDAPSQVPKQSRNAMDDMGWTFETRRSALTGQTEYQAVVYSVKTLSTFRSSWETSETAALHAALRQARGSHNSSCAPVAQMNVSRSLIADSCCSSSSDRSLAGSNGVWSTTGGGILVLRTATRPSHDTVLVWVSYVPDDPTFAELEVWDRFLPAGTRALGMLRATEAPEGLLLLDSLESAITLIRRVKARQLEFFDLFLSGGESFVPAPVDADVYRILFEPHSGSAVGLALVNVPMSHPACVHGLLRLSQQDTVALGHKRPSTETLRLLLTHAETSPVMALPPPPVLAAAAAAKSASVSQTPPHRRASFWCAICRFRAKDIPTAWRHLSRDPHEHVRQTKLDRALQWVADEFPQIASTLLRPTVFGTPWDFDVEEAYVCSSWTTPFGSPQSRGLNPDAAPFVPATLLPAPSAAPPHRGATSSASFSSFISGTPKEDRFVSWSAAELDSSSDFLRQSGSSLFEKPFFAIM